MSNGDSPKNGNLLRQGAMERRVPGLREGAPPSPCKVYRMIDGKKTLMRIE